MQEGGRVRLMIPEWSDAKRHGIHSMPVRKTILTLSWANQPDYARPDGGGDSACSEIISDTKSSLRLHFGFWCRDIEQESIFIESGDGDVPK